jgi:hypothetical protein
MLRWARRWWSVAAGTMALVGTGTGTESVAVVGEVRGGVRVVVREDGMGWAKAVTMARRGEAADSETGGPNTADGGLNGSIWDLVEKHDGSSRAFRMG